VLTALEAILAGQAVTPEMSKVFESASGNRVSAELDRQLSRAQEESSLVGRRLGHLRIEARIGRGGMGVVYRARDLALGRDVAVKVLPPAFSDAVRGRLLREAWAGSRLQHPNLATFYEAGAIDGLDFISMELVRGRTLRHVLADRTLPVDEAVALAAGLLEALVHAHAAGILHRDIKPENVMVTGPGAAKLLDLGLAKAWSLEEDGLAGWNALSTTRESSTEPLSVATLEGPGSGSVVFLTRRGAVLGTPGYMPPEQLQGEPVDDRSDLFPLAALLFEMLTGRRAIPGDTPRDRIEATEGWVASRMDRPDLPPGLENVVRRSLDPDPARRHPSAAGFLADLRRVVPDEIGKDRVESLAVLAFEDASDAPDDDWVGAGVLGDLTNALGRIPGLRVIPPSQVIAVQGSGPVPNPVEVGLRLSCTTVLTGSFRREGTTLRVRARMLDVASGMAIGEETFEGSMERVVEINGRLAGAVAAMLGRLPPTPQPGSAPRQEAYRHCVRGLKLWWERFRRGSIDEARIELERAVELAPEYVPGLAGLAELHAFRANLANDPAIAEEAIRYARRAIAVDPEPAEPHVWLGYALHLQGKHVEAYAAFREAGRRDPAHGTARYFGGLALQGIARPDELRALRSAAAESPESPGIEELHRWRRREALRLFQQSIELNPKFAWGWLLAGWQHLELDRFREARRCLEETVRREPDSVPALAGSAVYLGEALRRTGDLAAAREHCLAGLEAVERTDHLYRDSFRGLGLCALGRTALEQSDGTAARSAFRQAAIHLRGRPLARGGGQLLVQALAGSARAEHRSGPFEEALRLFEQRDRLSFGWLLGCTDDVSLLELSRAARAFGREETADELLARAVGRGSSEALRVRSEGAAG
jgi:serine/threonine protein kinase/tetratricopeptide (TPR) repeat protein